MAARDRHESAAGANAHYLRWLECGDVRAHVPTRVINDDTARFWAKVDRSGDCWVWTASCKDGYGQFWLGSHGRPVGAHRFSYELHKGPIPEGLHIDHLCRNPPCVNPDHLEAVTQRVNTLRGEAPPAVNARRTECVHGHPFTDANTYWDPMGYRRCRTCGNAHAAAAHRRAYWRNKRGA